MCKIIATKPWLITAQKFLLWVDVFLGAARTKYLLADSEKQLSKYSKTNSSRYALRNNLTIYLKYINCLKWDHVKIY
jgi:hypothetical protein